MKFGIATFPTDESIRPDELAKAVEERGFDSLFVSEHSNIPTSRSTPYPGGGDLPHMYYRTLDPFAALVAAATATRHLLLATGVCLLVQRDPIHTAKQAATIDRLSDGRFLFGVGAGWNREEMAQHGTDPTTRMALLRERVLAMKQLWTKEEAELRGDHVHIEPTYLWPKPLQQPHPPIIVGGMGPTVFDRVLEYGDAWMPNPVGQPAADLADPLADVRRRAADAGWKHVPVTIFGAPEEREQVERYGELGVDRCLFLLPALPTDEALRQLDVLASVANAAEGAGH